MNPIKRQKVLIFQPALAPYRVHIYNELARLFDVKVIFLRENLLSQKFNQANLRCQLTVDFEYLTTGFTFLRRNIRFGIHKFIKEFKPDVVVTVEFSPVTLAVALFRHFYPHSFTHVLWTDDHPESVGTDHWMRKMLRDIILPRVQGLIVISKDAASLYQTRYRSNAITGVVPIIQYEPFFESQLEAAGKLVPGLISKYNLAGRRVILLVGRLEKVKRFDRVLTAFSMVAPMFPDAVVVVVGSGPEQSTLLSLSQQLGISHRVLFVGRREDVELAAWYRIGSLLVLPSEFERFGAVVNEALLSGIPVICSNKAGAKMLINENVNGEVVDASNYLELQDSLMRWMNNVEMSQIHFDGALRASLMSIGFQAGVDEFVKVLNESLCADSTVTGGRIK